MKRSSRKPLKKGAKVVQILRTTGHSIYGTVWHLNFEPGLPHDPRLKSKDASSVAAVMIRIQDDEKDYESVHHIAFCYHGKAGPELNYLYRLVKCEDPGLSLARATLKETLLGMGYNVLDVEKDKQKALVALAKSKLSAEEFEAVRRSR